MSLMKSLLPDSTPVFVSFNPPSVMTSDVRTELCAECHGIGYHIENDSEHGEVMTGCLTCWIASQERKRK